MVELGRDARFAQEALAALGVVVVVAQLLERHRAVELDLPGAVHGAHAPSTENRLEQVARRRAPPWIAAGEARVRARAHARALVAARHDHGRHLVARGRELGLHRSGRVRRE
jgi:hypothetical protein